MQAIELFALEGQCNALESIFFFWVSYIPLYGFNALLGHYSELHEVI